MLYTKPKSKNLKINLNFERLLKRRQTIQTALVKQLQLAS